VAQAVRAGQLVFTPACSGLEDAGTGRLLPELHGDKAGQTRQALRRLEAALGRFSIGLDGVLRLDVFLRDVYFEDRFLRIARDVFGPDAPTMTVIGAELPNSAEVEIAAIAGG
jgi:enamine deaminase RidA (YjgF/YER057c/UK114 family)